MVAAPAAMAQGGGTSSRDAKETSDAAAKAWDSLRRAKKAGNLRSVESALESLMRHDRGGALDEAWSMMSSSQAVVRPIGSAFIAKHADAQQVIDAIRRLDVRRCPDERRWLVRSLGSKKGPETRKALENFLGDKDKLVRIAAAAALAELEDPEAMPALRRLLPSRPPVEAGRWDDDETAGLEMVASGAVLMLERAAKHEQESDRAAKRPATVNFRGEEARPTDRFLIMFRAKDFSPMNAKGETPWPKFAEMMDGAAERSVQAAKPVLGLVPMPPIRLYIADDRAFAGLAGIPTGFGGSSKGNEIVLRLGLPTVMAGVMRHEYIHAIHHTVFVDQPRWISEGLAESLTRSAERTGWDQRSAKRLSEYIEDGAVTTVIAWKRGAVSGPKEGDMYALSHLVVDFLRFGPFSASNARLAALMGRLARGEPAPKAIEELYGKPRQLDQDLRWWLGWERGKSK